MIEKSSLVGIGGILIGILGVVGPISWDYYKTKSDIEIKPIESSVIIEKPKKLEGLVVTYGGEELDELSKTIFSLTNTGRTAILKKDIVQPLTVTFTPASKVIDARIENMSPRGVETSLKFNRADSSIVFDIPLLNPGDRIEFSAMAKSTKTDFDAYARIVGISSLNIVNEMPREDRSERKPLPWTVFPVGAFSIFLLAVSLVGVSQVPAELRTKRALRDGSFELPRLETRAQCLAWANSFFFFTTAKERIALQELIASFPDANGFSETYRDQLMYGVRAMVEGAASNLVMVLVVVTIGCSGVWYVVANM